MADVVQFIVVGALRHPSVEVRPCENVLLKMMLVVLQVNHLM
jgi:hypothetical protein